MEKGNKTTLTNDQKMSTAFKKLELHSSSGPNHPTIEVEAETLVNAETTAVIDLPPEIWIKILNYADAPSLFACRLVNRQWNTISSGILRQRPQVEVRFRMDRETPIAHAKRKEKRLQDFVECIKKSKNCPFVRFRFGVRLQAPSQFFYDKSWLRFLSDFDVSTIKSLKLSFFFSGNNANCMFYSADKLGHLLLHKFPLLEEFGLDFKCSCCSGFAEVNLFPKSTVSSIKRRSIQLPLLKVVHFGSSMFSDFPQVVNDLLIAAVHLKEIECFRGLFEFDVSDFQFLDSIGKIGCVQSVEISPQSFSFPLVGQIMPNLPNLLKLRTLALRSLNELHGDPELGQAFLAVAPNFLSALFESSKNTLTSIWIHWDFCQVPRFTNLKDLNLRQDDDDFETSQLFPLGIKSMDIFPAVRSLNLDIENWACAFPHEDSIPRLPLVEIISLKEDQVTADAIYKLSLMCPNLKNLTIVDDCEDLRFSPEMNCLEICRAIWTHMTKLETLELEINLDIPENSSSALDSCFTGISEENCKRLCEMRKPLKKGGFPVQIPVSQRQLMTEREHPSILDMKDLKTLIVNSSSGFDFDYEMVEIEKDFFNEVLTWISRDYAFKLMPQIKLVQDNKECTLI